MTWVPLTTQAAVYLQGNIDPEQIRVQYLNNGLYNVDLGNHMSLRVREEQWDEIDSQVRRGMAGPPQRVLSQRVDEPPAAIEAE